jgi:ubiquinone/menaquinone biosynthesis C-methylase UbiE
MSEMVSDALLQGWTSAPALRRTRWAALPEHLTHAFVNPFEIEDLLIFDLFNLRRVLTTVQFLPEHLAWALYRAPSELIQRVMTCLPLYERTVFATALAQPVPAKLNAQASHLLLDALFWELTYWQTPELYAELVTGEDLHPGIFRQLEVILRDQTVLDVGAGCGRASFAALEHGAARLYAIEPSPGLRRLFSTHASARSLAEKITLDAGDFTHVPLCDQSVDVALSCSAFTADSAQGGEAALAELRRVTRPGGYIVLIWPRPADRSWLVARGFHYVTLACEKEMFVTFASWESAWRCVRRFYAHNANVYRYLRHARQPRIPFTVLGFNAPCDYCWLQV